MADDPSLAAVCERLEFRLTSVMSGDPITVDATELAQLIAAARLGLEDEAALEVLRREAETREGEIRAEERERAAKIINEMREEGESDLRCARDRIRGDG